MVHNGIEYGVMAAYAEGMAILKAANIGKKIGKVDAETTPLRDPEHYQFDLNLPDISELWRPGQRDLVLAARPAGVGPGQGSGAGGFRGTRFRFGRGTLDDQGGDRRGRAGPCAVLGALRTLQLSAARPISPTSCCRPCAYEFGGHIEKKPKPERDVMLFRTARVPRAS